MGLDNGFRVKSNIRKIERKDLPKEINYPFSTDYSDSPEIIYWRKCWGLRNMALGIVTVPLDINDEYEINTPIQIIEIIKGIISFMDEDAWEKMGDSIWTYQEIRGVLEDNIVNLSLILGYMKQNPDVYLEFYDSY